MAGAKSIHGTTFTFYIESTQGEGPGYTLALPQGTAVGWASAEGTNCHRHLVHEADPSWMRKADIENPQAVTSLLAQNVPITGIGSADGGSVSMTFHGSEVATSASSQVALTSLMEFLEHALGGLVRGNTTDVDTTVVSNVSYDVVSATNLETGQLIAIEDADNTGALYPQRILTLAGTSITTDRSPSDFTIASGDNVHAVATLYPNGPALSDCSDADYSTISVLIDKNGSVYEATGCVAQIDTVEFPRNGVPTINFSLMAGGVFPPGPNGLSTPTWTGSIQGDAGQAVGVKTRLHIQAYGTTTDTCYDTNTATLTPGLPRNRVSTVTQCDATLEGTAGYTLGRAETTFEVATLLNATNASTFQTAFEDKTAFVVTYYHINEAGKSWCVHLPKAYIKSPVYTESDETQWQTLSFVAHEDDGVTNASTPDLAKARFLLGLY